MEVLKKIKNLNSGAVNKVARMEWDMTCRAKISSSNSHLQLPKDLSL